MFVTSIVIFCNCIAEMKYWPNKYSVPAFWSIWIEFGSDFAFDKYLPSFFIITCVKWVLSCRCTCLRTRECRARRWLGLECSLQRAQPAAGLNLVSFGLFCHWHLYSGASAPECIQASCFGMGGNHRPCWGRVLSLSPCTSPLPVVCGMRGGCSPVTAGRTGHWVGNSVLLC